MLAGRCFPAAIVLFVAAVLPHAQAPTPVKGLVFEDANGNGRRDPHEHGLAGIAVSNQHDLVQTAADGAYRLPGAGYGVVFVSLPDGYGIAGSFLHASDTHVSRQSLDRLQQLRSIAEAQRPDFVLVRAIWCATRSASGRTRREAATTSIPTRSGASPCRCGTFRGITRTSASSVTSP